MYKNININKPSVVSSHEIGTERALNGWQQIVDAMQHLENSFS